MGGFEDQFVSIFLEEAVDMLADWERHCLDLLKNKQPATLDALFRSAHNLKGSARSVGLDPFAKFIHQAEDLINILRDDHARMGDEVFEALLLAQQVLVIWRDQLVLNGSAPPPEAMTKASQILEDLKKGPTPKAEAFGIFDEETPSHPVEMAPEPHQEKASDPERAPPLQTSAPEPSASGHHEESQATQGAQGTQSNQAEPTKASAEASPKKAKQQAADANESIRVPATKIDTLMQMIGELSIQQSTIVHCMKSGTLGDRLCSNAIQMAAKITRELQLQTMALRLVDLGRLFQRLERAARDVAGSQKKPIRVDIIGAEVELDKSVIDRMTDPLVHMVRNAVDHGIENPEERGHKPAEAVVTINATQTASGVSIEISDDGRGINSEKVLAKARKLGIVKPDVTPSVSQIYNLLFAPGFSTAEKVTDISGRGVGLDVVRRMVEDLEGTIEIFSELGKGTKFAITLPTNVGIIDSLVILASGQNYVVPIQEIAEVIDLRAYRVESQTTKSQTISLREHAVTVCPLATYIPDQKMSQRKKTTAVEDSSELQPVPALIVDVNGKRVGFTIDKVLGQQPVLIRKINGQLAQIPGFSGSTILASGEPAVILSPKVFARNYFSDKEVVGL